MATVFSPWAQGMMTSAYFLLGETNVSNMGLTKLVYWVMTPSTLRPRSTVSRLSRRASLKSSSVSTKIFMWHRSRTSFIASTRMPSMMITSAGSTEMVSSTLLCVTKSYTGTSTRSRRSSDCKSATRLFASMASGWSKLYVATFACSSGVRPR